jgi:hypothetical protein
MTIWIQNKPIYERDHLPAAQGGNVNLHLGGKYVPVVGNDVSLDLIGTSPREPAEWAWARWLVFVLQVSLELLDPLELFIAICANRPHPRARATTFATTPGALDNCMLSRYAGLSLGYVSMRSDQETWRRLPRRRAS